MTNPLNNPPQQRLPSSAYTSPEWLAREQTDLFSKTWAFAGAEARDTPLLSDITGNFRRPPSFFLPQISPPEASRHEPPSERPGKRVTAPLPPRTSPQA